MKKFLILIMCTILFLVGCNNIEYNEKSEGKRNQDIIIKDSEDTNKNSIEEHIEDPITIVIDPGHSSVGNPQKEQVAPNSSETKAKDVLGATGNYTNIPEYETNLSVSLLLKKELEDRGYNVVMTKTKVNESLSNIERANIGNENNANLVIRMHADSNDDTSISGASMQVPANNEYTSSFYDISKKYGEIIINNYATELNLKKRGLVYRGDLTGFNWSKVPVVLLEMGYLSNKQDDEFVSDTMNHEKIAKSIANGLDKCFK